MFNLMIIAGNATVQKLSDFIDKYNEDDEEKDEDRISS